MALSDVELYERGERAALLMNDPLIVDSFQELEEETIKAWKEARDVTARERAHAMITALARLREKLLVVSKQGEYARLVLEKDRQ